MEVNIDLNIKINTFFIYILYLFKFSTKLYPLLCAYNVQAEGGRNRSTDTPTMGQKAFFLAEIRQSLFKIIKQAEINPKKFPKCHNCSDKYMIITQYLPLVFIICTIIYFLIILNDI